MTTTAPPAASTPAVSVDAAMPAMAACIAAQSWTDAVSAAAAHLAATVGPVAAIARAEGTSISLSPIGKALDDAKRQQLGQMAAAVFRRSEGWSADTQAFAVRSIVSRRSGQAAEALVGFVTVAPSVPHLTAVSAALSAASSRENALDCQREAETAGRVVDLVDFLCTAADRDDVYLRLATVAGKALSAELTAVAVKKDGRFEVAAIEPTSVELTRDERKAIGAAADEAHVLGHAVAWPPHSTIDRPARKAIERAVHIRDHQTGWVIPLEDPVGRINTVVLAWSPAANDSLEQIAAWWNPSLGATIDAVTDARASWWERLKTLLKDAVSGRGKKLTCVGVFALAVLLAIPLPYKPKCDCQLAPSLRRFVAAPFAATLKQVHVEPGDVVNDGSLMAELDEREINWELAAIEAELKQADKRRSAALATANLAESQIADFDSKRLTARRDLLADRKNRLGIRAPMAGIVVDGDLTRAEGMPLELGQSLFEIAPLDTFVCEIHVPEFDINEIAIGQDVSISLDAQPGTTITGTIERIRPAAETWDDAVGFVVEVEVPNIDGTLRPGMTGDVRITAGVHPLGRNLFHRAYGKWRRGW